MNVVYYLSSVSLTATSIAISYLLPLFLILILYISNIYLVYFRKLDMTTTPSHQYNIIPVPESDQAIYKFYKLQRAAYWIENEIYSELEKDISDWSELDPKIKLTINRLVTNFNFADGITTSIIGDSISAKINNPTYKMLLRFTSMMEDIHNITYGTLTSVYLLPDQTINDTLEEINKVGIIRKRAEWLLNSVGLSISDNKYSDVRNLSADIKQQLLKSIDINKAENKDLVSALQAQEIPEGLPILLNCYNEGIMFSASFCIIFWLKTLKILPGLCKANEFISRDECAHRDVGIYAYKNLVKEKLPVQQVHAIFTKGLEIEREFVRYLLPENLLGLNAESMITYVEYMADLLLVDLGYAPLFGDRRNPFNFINLQTMGNRSTDFFADPSVSEYNETPDESTFEIDF